MGLLTSTDRPALVSQLLKLPNIIDQGVRRTLLAGLPNGLVQSIAFSNIPVIDVRMIVDAVDSDVWAQLPDGSWSIIAVLDNAVTLVEGSRLEADLRLFRDALQARAEQPTESLSSAGSAAPARLATLGELPDVLVQALLSAFLTRSDLRILVRLGLGENLNVITSELNNLETAVLDLIEWAGRNDRILDLVRAARERVPLNAALADVERTLLPALRARSKPESIAGISSFDACLIGDNQPFVNRTLLRDYVRDLSAKKTLVRALLVNGPTSSGKTYSYQYILFLGETSQDYHAPRIDFGRGDLPVREWADRIASALQLDKAGMPRLDDPTSNVNWISRYSSWLVNNIGDRLKWLVLDHIPAPGKTTNAAEIRQLINALVEEAHNSTTKLRIVLLGYRPGEIAALPADVVQRVRIEEIATVDRGVLEGFFRSRFEETDETFDESSVDIAVAAVLAQLPNNDLSDLKKFWQAVHKISKAPFAIEELKRFFRHRFEETGETFDESSVNAAAAAVLAQLPDSALSAPDKFWEAVDDIANALFAVEETT